MIDIDKLAQESGASLEKMLECIYAGLKAAWNLG